jgi:hypothetical protein
MRAVKHTNSKNICNHLQVKHNEKAFAFDLLKVIAAKWLIVRRQSWCLKKEHKKLYKSLVGCGLQARLDGYIIICFLGRQCYKLGIGKWFAPTILPPMFSTGNLCY